MASREFTMYVDDVSVESYNMKLVKYEVQSYAKRKTMGVNIPGAHGTQGVSSALASTDFLVWLICTGTDADDVNAKVRNFFAFMNATHEPRKIVFSDDNLVERYAVLDTPSRHRVINGIDGAFTELKLAFYMLDPFTYDGETSVTVDELEHEKELSVYNEGFECPAIFCIENTGNEKVTEITFVVNDERVNFSCELNPGQVLVLDTIEYEVRLDSEPHLEFWSGEMPMLKNGDNIIVQRNAQKSKLLLSVNFTKKWA